MLLKWNTKNTSPVEDILRMKKKTETDVGFKPPPNFFNGINNPWVDDNVRELGILLSLTIVQLISRDMTDWINSRWSLTFLGQVLLAAKK